MKLLSDKELVARVITTTDIAAFEELVRRHQNLVRNWLRQLTFDFGRADDIAQETFILVWNKIHTFRGDGEFKSWLIKIAYNAFLISNRRKNSESALLERLEANDIKEIHVTNNQELPDLPKLLSILTLEEKACMVLSYSYGYSHRETSDITSLPLGTVKSNIRRSTEKIRTYFKIEV